MVMWWSFISEGRHSIFHSFAPRYLHPLVNHLECFFLNLSPHFIASTWNRNRCEFKTIFCLFFGWHQMAARGKGIRTKATELHSPYSFFSFFFSFCLCMHQAEERVAWNGNKQSACLRLRACACAMRTWLMHSDFVGTWVLCDAIVDAEYFSLFWLSIFVLPEHTNRTTQNDWRMKTEHMRRVLLWFTIATVY